MSILAVTLCSADEVPQDVRECVQHFTSRIGLDAPTFDRSLRGSRSEWLVLWDNYSATVYHKTQHVAQFLDMAATERPALPDAPVDSEEAAISLARSWSRKLGGPSHTQWIARRSTGTRPLWTVEGWTPIEGLRGVGTEAFISLSAETGHVASYFWAGPYFYESPKSVFPVQEAVASLQLRVKEVLALSSLPPVVKEPERRWAWQVKRDQFSDAELPPADLTSRTSRQAYIITVDAGKYGKIVGRVDVETGAILAGAITSGGSSPSSIPAKSDPTPASEKSPEAPPDDSLPVLPVGVGVVSVAIGAFLLRVHRR